MYKIIEAAEILGVEKVIIFEKLINDSRYLKDYVSKDKSITYIDERGIKVLKALIEGKEVPDFDEEMTTQEVEDEKATRDEDKIIEQDDESTCSDGSDSCAFITEELHPSDHLKPLENYIDDEGLKAIFSEKEKIKEEIVALRNQLIALDSELKSKDEVIKNYSGLLKEDIDWIQMMETRLTFRLEHSNEVGLVEPQAGRNSGFNKFFKSKLFKNKLFKNKL